MIEECYLSTDAAAKYLGVAPITLEKHRVRGTGPKYFKLGTRLIRYRKHDLDAWAVPATSTSESSPHAA